jgi:hypothetical protein
MNILIFAELITYFAKSSEAFRFGTCGSDWSSLTLFVELFPVELFLVAFWYIPRHFYLSVKEINRSINDLHLANDINAPILAESES